MNTIVPEREREGGGGSIDIRVNALMEECFGMLKWNDGFQAIISLLQS